MIYPIKLSEAKSFLRVEFEEDDAYIQSLISLSKEMCELYLRKTIDGENCPDCIRQAMLLTIGHFYENRETETNEKIPPTIHYLLNPFREVRW